MTDASGAFNPFNPFNIGKWPPLGAAPSPSVSQPILPGWTFGNVTVNETNSSSPTTERDIVAEESYGRQIGKLMEAVCVLIARQKDAHDVPAFKDIVTLQARIEAIKTKAAADRIDQIRHDLERLKDHDKDAYKDAVQAIRGVLAQSEK